MIVPFEPVHFYQIEPQEAQKKYADTITSKHVMGMVGSCYTYIDEKPEAIIGMVDIWRGRSQVTAIIGDVTNWIKFTRAVKDIMHEQAALKQVNRIEMTTENNFPESERWAMILGFKLVSVMPCYGPDGSDHKMWVKLCQH